MKRLLLVFSLVILTGCVRVVDVNGTPYKFQDNFQTKMALFNEKLQKLSERKDALVAESNRVSEQELFFVRQLDDEQLSVYQSAVHAFKATDLSSQEMSRRNLQQVCDANTYSTIIQLLEQKSKIRRESVIIESEYESLQLELALIKDQERRQQEALRDYIQQQNETLNNYMLMNAIQNRR